MSRRPPTAPRRGAGALVRVVFEIGTEELPPQAAWEGARQLREAAVAAFAAARIATGEVRAYSTPRRLALVAEGVAARQADLVREVRGPAAKAAFSSDGRPTPAATGFARAQGVPVASLERRTTPQGEYLYAVRRETGAPTARVLATLLPQLASGLAFPKPMRWGTGTVKFARPVRWVLALLDRRILACEFAGVRAGRLTYGHRILYPMPVGVPSAEAYEAVLRWSFVLLNPAERRERIVSASERAADEVGGRPILDADLLAETVQLVEWPEAFAGRFADEFLALPREVLITVMQHHQKYFAVEDASGRLLPAFVAIRNGDAQGLAVVREGNEWVLRARLADARFFFEEDRTKPLAARVEELADLVFLDKLGTMAQKTRRLEALARWLGDALGGRVAETTLAALVRAAHLSKADLVTQMVRELPELQGIMGGIYARLDGEPGAVADAVREQYLPRGALFPQTEAGAYLALLDRLDTLVGALAAGMTPSGSQDPYGLRRAANGIVAILLDRGVRVSVTALCLAAADQHGVRDPERRSRTVAEVAAFLRQRLRTVLIEEGIGYDVVDAALEAEVDRERAPDGIDPDDYVAAVARARALWAFRNEPEFARVYAAFDRASRIVPKGFAGRVEEGRIVAPAERALYESVEAAGRDLAGMWRDDVPVVSPSAQDALTARYGEILRRLAFLADPVDRFFTDVLVMDPDDAIRESRLALLARVVELIRPVADLSRVVVAEGKPVLSS